MAAVRMRPISSSSLSTGMTIDKRRRPRIRSVYTSGGSALHVAPPPRPRSVAGAGCETGVWPQFGRRHSMPSETPAGNRMPRRIIAASNFSGRPRRPFSAAGVRSRSVWPWRDDRWRPAGGRAATSGKAIELK